MFDNIGNKAKNCAYILCVLGIVGSFILAFVYRNDTAIIAGNYYNHAETNFNAVRFFFILIGGSLGSYISSMVLYGYGEIVDNSNLILYHIQNNKTKEKEFSSNVPTHSAFQESATIKHKTCPKCGSEISANSKTCSYCGEQFL